MASTSSSCSTDNSCPICWDEIEDKTKNIIITECGHTFHSNCFLTNVSRNGFDCPMCRRLLIGLPAVEDEDEDLMDTDEDYDDFSDESRDEDDDTFINDEENVRIRDDPEFLQIQTREQLIETKPSTNHACDSEANLVAKIGNELLTKYGIGYSDLVKALIVHFEMATYSNFASKNMSIWNYIFDKMDNIYTKLDLTDPQTASLVNDFETVINSRVF